MKISIILDERRAKKDERFPVKIRFSKGKGKYADSSTNLYAHPNEFDKQMSLFSLNGKNIKEKHRQYNLILMQELERAEQLVLDLKKRGKGNLSAIQFKELFEKGNSPDYTFDSYFENFIKTKEGKTKELYQMTYKKLKNLFQKTIYFEDVDYQLIEKFESEMKKKGNSINTISINLRNIRSVFNDAARKKIVSKDLYPFDDYKIKKEETEHRNISVEKLRELFLFQGTESENWARDVAKLIFFLIGINASDLYNLNYPVDGMINYRRNKTGRLYSFRAEPETAELFERFKGKEHFLCFDEQFSTPADFLKKINGHSGEKNLKRGLKTIGEAIGVENLTSYAIRHTWGTIAGELEIAKETIAQSLGHGKKTVTDIYVKFDKKKIDEANRKVIDYVIYNSSFI
jgi:integrase